MANSHRLFIVARTRVVDQSGPENSPNSAPETLRYRNLSAGLAALLERYRYWRWFRRHRAIARSIHTRQLSASELLEIAALQLRMEAADR